MNGDYIKVMSNGSQLFVKDTECFFAIGDKLVRPTIEQFAALIKDGVGDFYGQQVIEYPSHAACRKLPIGTTVWELEWCETNEFYFVHVSISKEIDRAGNEIV